MNDTKKIFILILFVLMLFVCSCRGQNDIPLDTKDEPETTLVGEVDSEIELKTESETMPVTEPVPETEPPTDDIEEDDDYKDIALRETSLYENRLFALDGSQYYFGFSMPKDWSVSDDGNGGYNIVFNGDQIGKIYSSSQDGFEEWKTVNIIESRNKDVNIIAYIEKCGIGETLEFRRRYSFYYKEGSIEREIMLTVKYEELSLDADRRILNPSFTIYRNNANMSILSDLSDASIVIIGNSFVNTSNVGGILTGMLQKNSKNCKVTAISRSLVTLHGYVNDAVFMKSVEKGKYDAVFACGLYYTNDINNLGKLKEVCDISGTKLIIFPAHNESRSVISGACRKYNDLEILDWKGEIELLISKGVDKWDMCFNDEYLHSTPIAGYVGAQMIYRAIYGEIPDGGKTGDMAARVIGDYVTTGMIPLVDTTDLNYIK